MFPKGIVPLLVATALAIPGSEGFIPTPCAYRCPSSTGRSGCSACPGEQENIVTTHIKHTWYHGMRYEPGTTYTPGTRNTICIEAVPNLAEVSGTGMKVCTGTGGTGIHVVPNLPKCPIPVLMYRVTKYLKYPVPVLMYRSYRSVRYRY